jgi:CheY-like chemotaxis protein
MDLADHMRQPFPLVLLDYQMPTMDGLEVVRRIRQSPTLAGVSIVMLSSVGPQGEPTRSQELGVAAYINKPVRQAILLDTILSVLTRVPAPAPGRVSTPPPLTDTPHHIRALRVLVAEDNRVNQLVIRRLLERLGHHVVVCDNGRAAVAAVVAERPDLVLMDVQMPEMDGFAATAVIRTQEARHPEDRRLPIVALTAFAMKGDRERCLAAGMDDHLPKPIRRDDLAAVLARFAGGHSVPLAPTPSPTLDEVAALGTPETTPGS